MNKKLIAVDLDGTLLNSESKLSSYTIETIQKVSEQGHQVIITTGRPYRMADHIYKELGLESPMINFNGALTHIPNKKWSKELSMTLDKKYLLDMVERENDIQADFIAGEYRNKFYVTHTYHHTIDPALFGVSKISSKTKFEARKVTENPNAILFQTRAEDKYKAFALNYLLETYGLNRKDLIAFGDEQNDTDMLAFAGTGYAMKNANPVLLPYADKQTEYTNDQDGVARQLEKLFL